MAGSVPPLTALRQEDCLPIDAPFVPEKSLTIGTFKYVIEKCLLKSGVLDETKLIPDLRYDGVYYVRGTTAGMRFQWGQKVGLNVLLNGLPIQGFGLSPNSFSIHLNSGDRTSRAAILLTFNSQKHRKGVESLFVSQEYIEKESTWWTWKNGKIYSMLVECNFYAAFRRDDGFVRQLAAAQLQASTGFSNPDSLDSYLASRIIMVFHQ